MTCEDVRLAIHEAQDDAPAGTLPEPVRVHIASCAECRELASDLAAIGAALRAMPRAPLPAETLDAVWGRTIRATPSGFAHGLGFWRLAAAASLAFAVVSTTLFFVFAPVTPPGPTAVELAHAEAQAELVLGYTARALAATRVAAEDRVLAEKVAPAVRGVPMPSPSRSPR
jgi:anti-sigma-K factor RskA